MDILNLVKEGGSIVLLAAVLLFIGRHIVIILSQIRDRIAHLSYEIEKSSEKMEKVCEELRINSRDTHAIRMALRIAYESRSNGDDAVQIKNKYRLAAGILKKLEDDLKREGK